MSLPSCSARARTPRRARRSCAPPRARAAAVGPPPAPRGEHEQRRGRARRTPVMSLVSQVFHTTPTSSAGRPAPATSASTPTVALTDRGGRARHDGDAAARRAAAQRARRRRAADDRPRGAQPPRARCPRPATPERRRAARRRGRGRPPRRRAARRPTRAGRAARAARRRRRRGSRSATRSRPCASSQADQRADEVQRRRRAARRRPCARRDAVHADVTFRFIGAATGLLEGGRRRGGVWGRRPAEAAGAPAHTTAAARG